MATHPDGQANPSYHADGKKGGEAAKSTFTTSDWKTREDGKTEILEKLKSKDVESIVFLGDAGMGKTWMARKISEAAVVNKICSCILWLSVNEKYYDQKFIEESIARQLSLLPNQNNEEWEDDEEEEDEGEDKNEDEEEIKKENEAEKGNKEGQIGENKIKTEKGHEQKPLNRNESWGEKIRKELQKVLKHKKVLLVLDHVGDFLKGKEVLHYLKDLFPSKSQPKILITRRKNDDTDTGAGVGILSGGQQLTINFTGMSRDDAFDLFKEKVDQKKKKNSNVDLSEIYEAIPETYKFVPAAISMIAEALPNSADIFTLRNALEKLASYEKPASATGVDPRFYFAYEMLPTGMKKFFWHIVPFFHESGGVHYKALITHWIMEGYFDPFDHIEEVCEKGYYIFKSLLDRGFLKIQDDNLVTIEESILKMVDRRPHGDDATACLGLAKALRNKKENIFGNITHRRGMIKTSCSPKKWNKVSTLLYDGSYPAKAETIFSGCTDKLEVLAIFNTKVENLISRLSEMKNLKMLVLRNCGDLSEEDINGMQSLKALTVLEISSCKLLKDIPYELFKAMTQLESLNLSGLNIRIMPASLSELKELRLLILRGCKQLTTLSIKGLDKLQVLDLCGAENLRRIKEGSFKSHNKELQMINFSQTRIEKLPKFHHLDYLKRILLRDCHSLVGLPNLSHLPRLQILDLAGSSIFRHFNGKYYPNEKLNCFDKLNLSNTSIPGFPSNDLLSIFLNLSELNLSGCRQISKLPNNTKLENLERLDVSDAPNLVEIEPDFFQDFNFLYYVNLSNTKLQDIPSLSNLINLRELLLNNCSSLTNLPKIEGLTRLEVLDLRGCTAPADESFQHLPCLRDLRCDQLSSEVALESIGTMNMGAISQPAEIQAN